MKAGRRARYERKGRQEQSLPWAGSGGRDWQPAPSRPTVPCSLGATTGVGGAEEEAGSVNMAAGTILCLQRER